LGINWRSKKEVWIRNLKISKRNLDEKAINVDLKWKRKIKRNKEIHVIKRRTLKRFNEKIWCIRLPRFD